MKSICGMLFSPVLPPRLVKQGENFQLSHPIVCSVCLVCRIVEQQILDIKKGTHTQTLIQNINEKKWKILPFLSGSLPHSHFHPPAQQRPQHASFRRCHSQEEKRRESVSNRTSRATSHWAPFSSATEIMIMMVPFERLNRDRKSRK